jgi:hypothetical protein
MATARKFVKDFGGGCGSEGMDMLIELVSKEAIATAKKRIPKGIIRECFLDGRLQTLVRF